jgi:photosystem II stability/assembly factor-like uncharacterized protein
MSRMRAFHSVLASIVVVVLLGAAPAYPWHGGGTLALAIDPATPTTVYAAGSRGEWGTVYKTTDGGASWQATSLIRTHISVLAIDPVTPTTVYAGTDSGVVKTADGGASWHSTALTNNISALAINPLTPTTVFAGRAWDATGQAWEGTFKSADGGVTWHALPATYLGFTDATSALAIDPVTLSVYAGKGYGVSKSTDAGATWTGTFWGVTGATLSLAIDPVTTTTVYAGASVVCCDESSGDVLAPGGVFKSIDGGATWQALGLSDQTFFALAIDPVTTTTIYAGTSSGVSKSIDGGASWQAASPTRVRALAIDPLTPTTLYAATGTGVFKSIDGGTNWSDTGLILIEQPPFISVRLDPPSVLYGASSTGTVTLATPAPAGGIAVTLSSDSEVATVPAKVTVPAGVTSASFTISTNPITRAVTVSATLDGLTASATLMVYKTTLYFLQLSPTSVPSGTSSTGTVGLSAAAPVGGAIIALSSSNPAVATVPATVTVPAGATRATFTVSTGSVTAPTAVEISADNYWAVLTVNPSPPDTEPPNTWITSVVDGNGASVPTGGATLSRVISIAFTGSDNVAVAGFECRLDGGDFAPCTSPVTSTGLAVGGYSFDVRALDTSGNRDGSPAAQAWSVDAPPDTIITSAVDGRGKAVPNGGTTRLDRITFSFAGSDNAGVAGFECSLDGAAFAACASPKTHGGIARGTHTFRVRAVDSKGFRDQSPAAFTWTRQ